MQLSQKLSRLKESGIWKVTFKLHTEVHDISLHKISYVLFKQKMGCTNCNRILQHQIKKKNIHSVVLCLVQMDKLAGHGEPIRHILATFHFECILMDVSPTYLQFYK
jgi:hypothetical protein